MEIELIKSFNITCVSCDTQTRVSLQDADEHLFHEYQCPVCKQQLSANVSDAIRVIRSYNEATSRLLQVLEDEVISVESD